MNDKNFNLLKLFSESGKKNQLNENLLQYFIYQAGLDRGIDLQGEMQKINLKKSNLSSMQRKVIPYLIRLKERVIDAENESLGDNTMTVQGQVGVLNQNAVNAFSEQMETLSDQKVETENPFNS